MLLNRGLRQDKQCTYNLTMKRVRVTTVGVEEQYVLNVMNTYRESCLSHLACHSRHFCAVIALSPVACRAITCFSRLSHKRQGFFLGGGNVTEFTVCYFVYNVCESKNNSAKYYQKRIEVFTFNCLSFLSDL